MNERSKGRLAETVTTVGRWRRGGEGTLKEVAKRESSDEGALRNVATKKSGDPRAATPLLRVEINREGLITVVLRILSTRVRLDNVVWDRLLVVVRLDVRDEADTLSTIVLGVDNLLTAEVSINLVSSIVPAHTILAYTLIQSVAGLLILCRILRSNVATAVGVNRQTVQSDATMLLTEELTGALVEDVVDVYLSGRATGSVGTVADYVDIVGSLLLVALGEVSLGTEQVGLSDTDQVRLVLSLLNVTVRMLFLRELPETWEDIEGIAGVQNIS